MNNNLFIDINTSIITGKIKDDPSIRRTSMNKEVLNILIAVRYMFEHYSTKENKERISIISVSCWGSLVEKLKLKLKKGDNVLVHGRLQSNTWETQDGIKNNIVEIIAEKINILNKGEPDA